MRKWAWLFLICLMPACIARDEAESVKYGEVRPLMGALVQLDVCRDRLSETQIAEAYRDVWARFEEIAWRMNVFDARSDVARINTARLQPVTVGVDTYEVIRRAIGFSQLTNGAFDITVWPLIEFWKQCAQRNVFPSSEEVADAKAAVGFQNVELLDNGQVRLREAGTEIDLGGIAAGYAVDEGARIFRRHGVVNFFIDAGGDIYAGGLNCRGEPWRIGIRDPRDASRIIDVVGLSDQAATTSGDYEKFYTIQGQTWSHIIDPVTGYPQKGVISATVIAPTTMEADALATAVCVLGGRSGVEQIDRLGKGYGSLILSEAKAGSTMKITSQEYENFRYKK